MIVSKHLRLKFLVTASAGLLLALAACQGVKSSDIQGLLQAMEGKEMVITIDDGSTVRVRVENAQSAAQAQELVGTREDVEVRQQGGAAPFVEGDGGGSGYQSSQNRGNQG
ncbi:MAG: hypothetical protein AAB037_01250, partial [Chloroflexota bacterium]